MTEEIRSLLAKGTEHDVAARECRRQAGRLLAELRYGKSMQEFSRHVKGMGLDTRTALLLMRMGNGAGLYTDQQAAGDKP